MKGLDYKAKAKALKAIGALPSYDLRKPLNESQKRHIRRVWRELHEIATAPEKFFIREVSRTTGKTAKDNGIASKALTGKKKAKIYIPRDHYQTVKIKKDKIILQAQEKKVNKQRHILLTPTKKLLDRLKYLSEHKKLKPYEYLQVRVGNNSPFHQMFDSYENLLNYLSGWNPKDFKADKDNLIMQISIAIYTDFDMIREQFSYDDI